MTRHFSATAEAAHPQWWNEHQVAPMMPLSLTKAIDDGSESTHSGSPSEPPMSPEPPQLSLASGKLPELSPACSTLGSKSTGVSPVTLTLDSECPASPVSPLSLELGSTGLEFFGSVAPFDQAAQAPFESHSSCAPSVLPPPPCYHAPLVFMSGMPGLPPPPALPPGVPEPPQAPPRLPANVPLSTHAPWPRTAPPAATTPWQLGLATQAPVPLSLCDQSATLSSTVPSGLVTTPLCTPSGVLAGSIMLPLPSGPLLSVDAATAGFVARGWYGLDDEVTMATHALAMQRSGPFIPPLPPSSCYGPRSISSVISESLETEASEAVAAAARNLGDKPVKVLLPWYPAHAGVGLYDNTKPAKVMIAS